jgi:O-antigen/teichoic acid export membrane protein
MLLSYLLVPTRATPKYDRTLARELFSYGRFVTGFTILQFAASEVDNLVVGKILGFEALGLYTMAWMLANLPATHIARTASVILFPAYSAIQHEREKLRVAYLTVLRAVGGVAIPAAAGLIALAPDIVRVVYGERWMPGVSALRILAFMGAARAIGMLSGYLYNAMGKPNISFYLIAARLALVLAWIYPMAVRFGLEGAAIAVGLPLILEQMAGLVLLRRQVGIAVADTVRILATITARSAAMAAACLAVRAITGPATPATLLLLVGVGVVTYGALSFGEIRKLQRELLGLKRAKAAQPVAPSLAATPGETL